MSVGGITAWFSTGVEWIDQFGVFGWWIAGLFGTLIATIILLGFGWLRYAWVKTRAIRHWRSKTDAINPMDTEFRNKRINLLDLVSPIDSTISGKTFIDCELIGPLNLFILGSVFNGTTIGLHDLVLLGKEFKITNGARFENSQVIRGTLHKVTILLPPNGVPQFFRSPGGNWITDRPTEPSGPVVLPAPGAEKPQNLPHIVLDGYGCRLAATPLKMKRPDSGRGVSPELETRDTVESPIKRLAKARIKANNK